MCMAHIKYTPELLQEAANNSFSIAGILRYLTLKQAGGTHCHISNKLKQYNIDTSHFTGQGHMKGKTALNKENSNQILRIYSKDSLRVKGYRLKRAMMEMGVKYECNNCGLSPIWMSNKLILPVDHINGDWLDNSLDNLRFLCPNCHSQTETFGRKKSTT